MERKEDSFGCCPASHVERHLSGPKNRRTFLGYGNRGVLSIEVFKKEKAMNKPLEKAGYSVTKTVVAQVL